MPDGYLERYAAQVAAIGRQGQRRLRRARVHIAGFGGLGNLTAFLLAAAGVGRISANDPQSLELDNLGRFVCGSQADLGRPKVEAAARFFRGRPDLAFTPILAPTESALVDDYLKGADWVICASNTIESRIACARKALRYRQPLLDAAVADGRLGLFGSIKYKLPECAWAACPACYLEPPPRIERGEGLLLTVISVTASVAAHLVVQFLANRGAASLRGASCCSIELQAPYRIEFLAVAKRERCSVCGPSGHGF